MDGIGVLLKKNIHGRYHVYIIWTEDGEIISSQDFDEDRAKGAAIRQASLALVEISQGLTRGEYPLVEDVSI